MVLRHSTIYSKKKEKTTLEIEIDCLYFLVLKIEVVDVWPKVSNNFQKRQSFVEERRSNFDFYALHPQCLPHTDLHGTQRKQKMSRVARGSTP